MFRLFRPLPRQHKLYIQFPLGDITSTSLYYNTTDVCVVKKNPKSKNYVNELTELNLKYKTGQIYYYATEEHLLTLPIVHKGDHETLFTLISGTMDEGDYIIYLVDGQYAFIMDCWRPTKISFNTNTNYRKNINGILGDFRASNLPNVKLARMTNTNIPYVHETKYAFKIRIPKKKVKIISKRKRNDEWGARQVARWYVLKFITWDRINNSRFRVMLNSDTPNDSELDWELKQQVSSLGG
jgi:hypothetical protein